jgi:ferric-dicitrate binding protein FerR (iron transport regulator)
MLLDFKELLKKFNEKDITLEELARLRSYFSAQNNESLIKKSLYQELINYVPLQQTLPGPDFNRIFEKVQSNIHAASPAEIEAQIAEKRKPVFLQIMKVAAIVVPFFILGGILSYFILENRQKPENITYTEIRAPYGARTEIILPDGSKVWLNAGSRIKYMNIFNRDNREIQLHGEAYFKVAKNEDLPFDVKTGDLSIQALGTEFNVKSYDDEDIIETTLVEGKISINQGRKHKGPVFLEPHQQAVYMKYDKNLTVKDMKTVKKEDKPEVLTFRKGVIYIAEKIDPQPIIAWKENRLILKGEELSSLVIKLERKYDVKFIFGSEKLKGFRFSGTLENETLTQVLDVIKLSAPLGYKLQGKTVMIFENKQRTEQFNFHLKRK